MARLRIILKSSAPEADSRRCPYRMLGDSGVYHIWGSLIVRNASDRLNMQMQMRG